MESVNRIESNLILTRFDVLGSLVQGNKLIIDKVSLKKLTCLDSQFSVTLERLKPGGGWHHPFIIYICPFVDLSCC